MNLLQRSSASAVRPSSSTAAPLRAAALTSQRRVARPIEAAQSPVASSSSAAAPNARRGVVARAAPTPAGEANTSTCKFISRTEIPAFIQRDDLIDQLYHWSIIEAGEAGFRNFGMPMNVEAVYSADVLWGFKVGIFRDGVKLTDIGVMFDQQLLAKHEWLGRGEDGFPVLEGRVDDVLGKTLEIWKMDLNPVTEDLRHTIRAFCTGLVGALNRYYAFGSVFVDDERG